MIATPLLTEAIKKELGSLFSTEAHTSNDLIRYINSAVRKICISKNFTFNKFHKEITITEWTKEYEIPFQIETFFILNEAWDEVEFYNFEDYYRQKDKSNIIWIWDDVLVSEYKWTFTIFYRGFPTTITEANSSITIPEHFYDLLVVWAVYYWFMDIKNYSKAWTKKEIFDWMIKSMATRASDPQPFKTKRMNEGKTTVF